MTAGLAPRSTLTAPAPTLSPRNACARRTGDDVEQHPRHGDLGDGQQRANDLIGLIGILSHRAYPT
jgi:hypothetical protein